MALTHGDNRRKNVLDALTSIDAEVKAGLARKKYVVIKPNNVSTEKQLASTHADALNGILDYLAPRFRGPVMIAESSAGDTLEGYRQPRIHAAGKGVALTTIEPGGPEPRSKIRDPRAD